jgi:alkylation response protein AidB-like acyl-CoA dehydrogenase
LSIKDRLARRLGATADLQRRVAELEAEVQECRNVNLRVAELTDLVTQLLVPLAAGDQAAVRDLIERYHAGL